MAMTDQELKELATELAQQIFVSAQQTAHSNLDELKDAFDVMDTVMNANTNQLQSTYPGETVKIAFLTHAKAAAPNLTNQEAGIVLAYWALKEVGL